MLVGPDESGVLIVRTTFGLLLSRDAGRNWDWVCERAIGYSGVQDPTLGLMQGGTILAGLSEGFAVSDDSGCNWHWAEADLNGSPVVDLTVRRDRPSSALALLWDAAPGGYRSRLVGSEDTARSFVPYGNAIDETVLVLTLDTAASNPQRIYASGTRVVDGVRSASLFVSNDDAQHWTERALPFDPKLEQGAYIAAVDPNDADTVYVRTSSASVSRLMITRDAGQSFEVAYSGSLLAFALSPDGRMVYFGGSDGLHAGPSSTLEFELRSSLRLLCLAASSDTLYACSDEHSGFTVGGSRDGGFSFSPLLHLNSVRGPLHCAAGASSETCVSDWPALQSTLGVPPATELDGGSDAGSGNTPEATKASSSCSFGASAGAERGWCRRAALPLLLLAFSLRCRSRARRHRLAR
jgi:hypothetical protein